jgi:hypothetical protein
MALTWKKPWNRGGDAPRVDCECVCVLNIPRYIFIVQRLSILSKLDSNNPYRIWVELYLLNLNYLIILDPWPIWPSWRPRRSRFTSWSYLSFRPILFAAHLLVWPSYGDNTDRVTMLALYNNRHMWIATYFKEVFVGQSSQHKEVRAWTRWSKEDTWTTWCQCMSLWNASWMPRFTFMTMKLEKNATHQCGFLYILVQLLNPMTSVWHKIAELARLFLFLHWMT